MELFLGPPDHLHPGEGPLPAALRQTGMGPATVPGTRMCSCSLIHGTSYRRQETARSYWRVKPSFLLYVTNDFLSQKEPELRYFFFLKKVFLVNKRTDLSAGFPP